MGRVAKFLVYSLITLILVTTCVLLFTIEGKPLVDRAPQFRPDHIERAKQIVDNNDPRRLKPGELRTISLSEEDLDLAALYLFNRYLHGSSRIALHAGTAHVALTFQLPLGATSRYINIDAVLVSTDYLPHFGHLQIGRLPIPLWCANPMLHYAIDHLRHREDLRPLMDSVLQVSLSQERVRVTYLWHPDIADGLRKAAVPAEDQERLRVYQQRLAEITSHRIGRGGVSLVRIMQPLLRLATQRSRDGNAVAENRALILALTFYVNDKPLDQIVPNAKSWPRPLPQTVTLSGRDDTAKHFIVSAALSAYAGEPLADVIGVYKEVDDSRVGSGFSFDDIAPDRAGSRFGELAAASVASAKRLQAKLGAQLRESDIVPFIDDLPGSMSEKEFKRRFGGVDGAGYRQMMNEIERRVAALPFNR
jgi:hypothetical protein